MPKKFKPEVFFVASNIWLANDKNVHIFEAHEHQSVVDNRGRGSVKRTDEEYFESLDD